MDEISRDFRGAIISVIMPCSISLSLMLMINQESQDKVVQLTKNNSSQEKA